VLRDGFISFRSFFERPAGLRDSFRLMPADSNRTTSCDREIPASFYVFDILRSSDIPQLLDSFRGECLIVNPIDGDRNAITEADAHRLVPARIHVVSLADPDGAVRQFVRNRLVEAR
jgi:hypothetical protein